MFSKLLKFSSVAFPTYYLINKNTQNSCCGIIGFLGQQKIADEIISQGIHLLQNRGYDSSGIVTIENNELFIDKMTSDLEKGIDCIQEIKKIAKQKHKNRSIGIGHTRWATCGEINNISAHPHVDNKKRIALVHNGTIYNYQKLKTNLQEKGYVFESNTDTEVIAKLIGFYLDEGKDLLTSMKTTCEQLDGTWGLVLIHKDFPNQIICGRKGSPLLVGFGEKGIFISSEQIAFQKYANSFIRLNDREILQLNLEEDFKESVKERIITTDNVEIKMTPQEGFRNFFEEEIYEQPEAIRRALSYNHRLVIHLGTPKLGGFETNKEKALGIENMVLIGCGSSFNACLYAMHLFKAFEIFDTVSCIEASEFEIYDLPKKTRGIICVTQSGESADILNAIRKIKNHDNSIPVIGVTNVVGSMITTLCDWGVFQNSGREIAVGASKSFTTQIIVLYLIALWYSYFRNPNNYKFERNAVIQIFPSLPLLVEKALEINKEIVKEIAKKIYSIQNMFIIGRTSTYPFVREMCLKFKELTYIHVEGIPGGELKHGPLAMINSNMTGEEDQTVLILIILDNQLLEKMKITLSEILTRKGYAIVITDCKEKLEEFKINFLVEIPHSKPFGPLLSLFPVQLLVNEVALLKNINPDKPRNLAKCVTVV